MGIMMEATNFILILILLGLCLAMLATGIRRKGLIYEFPFFAGAIFFSFVLPQLPGLALDPHLPEAAFAKTMVVTLSCAALTWLGWSVSDQPMRHLSWEMNERRLITAAVFLSLAGAFFFFQISRLPEDVKGASLYTGLPVAYLFFAKLLNYGFALAVICFVRTRSRVALATAAFGALFYVDRIVFAGRRGDTSELILLILLALWFQRGIAVPRMLPLAGVLAATLVMASTGDYRKVATTEEGPSIEQVTQIDFVGNLKYLMVNGGPEMRNAVYKINAIDENMILDFGAFHWNTLVFNFIPAQLVGAEFKGLFSIPVDNPYEFTSHLPMTGSTETGMADAFGSFWYFGAVKFLLIALVLKRYYRSAMLGCIPAQLFYMLLLTPGMHSITHHTHFVLTSWVHLTIFLIPVLMWARVPGRRAAGVGHIRSAGPNPRTGRAGTGQVPVPSVLTPAGQRN
jgi:hypothetical protein